jgi:hypothetical protein
MRKRRRSLALAQTQAQQEPQGRREEERGGGGKERGAGGGGELIMLTGAPVQTVLLDQKNTLNSICCSTRSMHQGNQKKVKETSNRGEQQDLGL